MFDVKKHLIKVQGGRQYLPVAARLIWFRTEHPDWGIDTHAIAIDMDKQYAVFEASVFNAEGKLMAKGTKMETIRGFGDWLEKAETGAIGRALAVCGFGTQFAPDLDEPHHEQFDGQRQPDSYSQDRGFNTPRYGTSDPVGYQTRSSGQNFGDFGGSINSSESLSMIRHDSRIPSDAAAEAAEPNTVRLGVQTENCESCNVALKPSQLSLSLRKYGAALCPDCQRKRKTEQAA